MIRMKYAAIVALPLLGACASVPRDSGLGDVQQRTSPDVVWQSNASSTDDPRVREMLSGELDADRAAAIAMQNNPRLQVILAELGIARADLIAASTIPNPVFGYEARFPGSPYRPYEITLAQSLIDLIQLPRRRQLGQLGFEAAKLRVSAETLRFAAQVRDVYYAHLAATQSLAMARLSADAARTSAEVAIRQHTAGNITDLDLENEQAVYEQAKLDLARAEQQNILTREALVRAMGLRDPSLTFAMPSDFPALPEREMTQEELQALVATRRLDVAVAQREVELAERSLGIARTSAIGDVVVDVHRSREPAGEVTTGPGIELPIPIFNRGQAARARAEATLLRDRQRLAGIMARAGSEVRAATARLEAARARVEYYRNVVLPRRARIVELTKLEHNSMLVGVHQLLQARQNEANARRDYVEAQRDYWSARTGVEAVLNGTSTTELGSDDRRIGEGDRRGGR
jgi:cobalt-zinc-cadmium efflux system outer membrane protein